MPPVFTPTHVVDAEVLRPFLAAVFERVGLLAEHAADAADVLVWASLRGIDTHGVRNAKKYYVDWIREGRIKARPEHRITHETGLSAVVDGDGGLGLAAACWGMRLAMAKATATGVGLVSMRNSQHLGAAGYYAYLATRHDLVGVCTTGYLFAQGNDLGLLPAFGARPMLSTNPLSVAFPGGEEPPFVLDMATSVVPLNRIELYKEAGLPVPLGWGLDAAGQPTTDPAAVRQLLPLGGPREQGGHKGYNLALVVEVLSAVLSGAWCPTPGADGIGYAQEREAHFFGAFRIDLFRSPASFKAAMDALMRALRTCPPVAGQERVWVAGEIEHATEQERRRHGIPLGEKTVADLRALAQAHDVPLPLTPVTG